MCISYLRGNSSHGFVVTKADVAHQNINVLNRWEAVISVIGSSASAAVLTDSVPGSHTLHYL